MAFEMPELPEVETTCRGISPHVKGSIVRDFVVRQPKLRWPIPIFLSERLIDLSVLDVQRRGKYILIQFDLGALMIHLGMSGSLRIVPLSEPVGKHDHVDICFDDNILRFTDPRRFGSVLWQPQGEIHELLYKLGPEPLSEEFSSDYLQQRCLGRKVSIKQLIMDSKVVVGVGNIYASEALFKAGIDPRKAAGSISADTLMLLVDEIKIVLSAAITQGGTTLKDFVGGDGKPGYFKQQLNVYGRGGQPCVDCLTPLSEIRLGQRASVFCRVCQR